MLKISTEPIRFLGQNRPWHNEILHFLAGLVKESENVPLFRLYVRGLYGEIVPSSESLYLNIEALPGLRIVSE
jgi:hypothetical protein